MNDNGQNIEPVNSYLALPKHARWAMLIEMVMGSPNMVTIKHLAEKLGVNRKTLHQDMDDPEFMKFKDTIIRDMVKSNLMMHAWKNVTKQIVEKGNINVSKWLIENFYKPPEEAEDDKDSGWDTVDDFENTNGEMSEIITMMTDLARKIEKQGKEF